MAYHTELNGVPHHFEVKVALTGVPSAVTSINPENIKLKRSLMIVLSHNKVNLLLLGVLRM